MKRILVILIAFAVTAVGCSNTPAGNNLGPKGDLVIRDSAGNVIATGKLRLPTTLPAVGQQFEGQWSLSSSSPPFPASAPQTGRYSGYSFAGGVSCDLAPHMQDNNVVLSGTVQSQRFSGKWSHATIAGDRELGTFSVTWPSGDAR